MKKIFDDLIKLPLMLIVIFFQNTWKALLVGILFIATLIIGAAYDIMWLPLIMFSVICLIPFICNIINILNYFRITKNGTKATADIWATNPAKNYILINFRDSENNEHQTEVFLEVNRKIRKMKQIEIFYDEKKPENVYVKKYTLVHFIIMSVFSLICAAIWFICFLPVFMANWLT